MAVLCRGAEGMSLELAQVEVMPEGSGWIRGTTALEMQGELGAEESRPRDPRVRRCRGVAQASRTSLEGGYAGVANVLRQPSLREVLGSVEGYRTWREIARRVPE